MAADKNRDTFASRLDAANDAIANFFKAYKDSMKEGLSKPAQDKADAKVNDCYEAALEAEAALREKWADEEKKHEERKKRLGIE